jgi:hypothetical protein
MAVWPAPTAGRSAIASFELRKVDMKTSATMTRLGVCISALAGALAVQPASAVIVTFTTPVVVPNTLDGLYINLMTGATGSSPALVPGWDFNPWSASNTLTFFWNGTPAGTSGGVAVSAAGPYIDLPIGAGVGAASTFSTSSGSAQTLAFQATGTHTLGLRFFNESTSAINYGVLSMVTTGPEGFPATITGWSFENSGSAFAQVVPEASTAAMLALGILCIGAVGGRRRTLQRPN